jgi:hypothetical protein
VLATNNSNLKERKRGRRKKSSFSFLCARVLLFLFLNSMRHRLIALVLLVHSSIEGGIAATLCVKVCFSTWNPKELGTLLCRRFFFFVIISFFFSPSLVLSGHDSYIFCQCRCFSFAVCMCCVCVVRLGEASIKIRVFSVLRQSFSCLFFDLSSALLEEREREYGVSVLAHVCSFVPERDASASLLFKFSLVFFVSYCFFF